MPKEKTPLPAKVLLCRGKKKADFFLPSSFESLTKEWVERLSRLLGVPLGYNEDSTSLEGNEGDLSVTISAPKRNPTWGRGCSLSIFEGRYVVIFYRPSDLDSSVLGLLLGVEFSPGPWCLNSAWREVAEDRGLRFELIHE